MPFFCTGNKSKASDTIYERITYDIVCDSSKLIKAYKSGFNRGCSDTVCGCGYSHFNVDVGGFQFSLTIIFIITDIDTLNVYVLG